MAVLLSFEQAPPISVPFRFFLTAPWLGAAAGLLLAWEGSGALASRWTPEALALTHLLTVGYMLQAMCGALLQFIPVAAGGSIPRPRLLASIVQPALAAVAAILAAAFLTGQAGLFLSAAVLAAIALGSYIAVVGVALIRTPAAGTALRSLRTALAGLGMTALLGIALAAAMAGVAGLPLLADPNIHAAWGLGGWALLLLVGTAQQVVPMFQLTPHYPEWLGRWLPPSVLALLVLWLTGLQFDLDRLSDFLLAGGMALGALFAAITLRLIAQRRRRTADATLRFFQVAMASLIAIPFVWILGRALPEFSAQAPVAVGLLAIVGVFVSAINGMLYKIVPFLNWLHLKSLAGPGVAPPNMHSMIPEPAMRGQLRVHVAALALLLATSVLPELTFVAGLAFAGSCAWLGWNLAGAAAIYVRLRGRIRAGASVHGS